MIGMNIILLSLYSKAVMVGHVHSEVSQISTFFLRHGGTARELDIETVCLGPEVQCPYILSSKPKYINPIRPELCIQKIQHFVQLTFL